MSEPAHNDPVEGRTRDRAREDGQADGDAAGDEGDGGTHLAKGDGRGEEGA